MIHPPFLKPGDKIALVSVAGKVSRESVEKAVSLLEEENFVMEITPHAFGQFHMFSGYCFPVVFGFPGGHELPNFPLIMGSEISLEVTEEGVLINQSFN